MKQTKSKIARKLRVRRKLNGSSQKPRLTVFKSNLYIYAQIIDDVNSKTIISASDIKMAKNKEEKVNKIERATKVGESLALQALKNKIKQVVFDRGGYKYHGRVKALAEGARKGGLVF